MSARSEAGQPSSEIVWVAQSHFSMTTIIPFVPIWIDQSEWLAESIAEKLEESREGLGE